MRSSQSSMGSPQTPPLILKKPSPGVVRSLFAHDNSKSGSSGSKSVLDIPNPSDEGPDMSKYHYLYGSLDCPL